MHVRIAETQPERAAGLMSVMALAPDDGMAFVFDGPVTDRFWMKDTLIPLSVAFVGEDGRVISESDMDPCTADPCPTYPAAGPYAAAGDDQRAAVVAELTLELAPLRDGDSIAFDMPSLIAVARV